MKLLYPLLLLPLLAGCPFAKCGDNTLDKNEACDDGNTNDADGCEADCSFPACSNGINDPGELCFGGPVKFTTDEAPFTIVSADFNGDTHTDFATANSVGQSISILLGDGTGNFTRQPEIELGQFVIFVAAGDVDGDGVLDLVIPVQDLDRIEVFRGVGDGTFEAFTLLTSSNPSQLFVADFNKDGDQDIATNSTDGIALFLNDGTGGFQAPRISFIGNNPILAHADFDGDQNVDVVAGVGGDLILLLGDGIGNLAPQAPQLTGEIQGSITAADFNGDQLADLAAAQFALDGTINIFTNQAGIFTQAQTFSVTGPFAIVAADLNQDGTPDIAVASDLENNGNAHFVAITSDADVFVAQEPLPTGNGNLRGITTSDLNEDGVPDVILTDTTFDQLTIFLSQP
jgi:cysteine-rich repeat protein